MIIGLLGRMRSGKNTAADALVRDGFASFAFADRLRETLLAVDPYVASGYRVSELVSLLGWEGVKAHPAGQEVRRLLQELGTACRDLDRDIWVRPVIEAARDGDAVITDVRFPNECDAVRAAGGYLVRVTRPSLPATVGRQHVSETACDGVSVDVELCNCGSVEDLHDAARQAVTDLRYCRT